MKVILATITLIDLLAIGIIGTNISSLENVFAQKDIFVRYKIYDHKNQ